MFEDSTFESTGKIHASSRGWMLATFAFNSIVVLALTLFPLLYPEMLPRMMNNILMLAAPPQQSQPQPLRQPPVAHATRASEIMGHQLAAPRIIPAILYSPTAPEAPKMTSAATWGTDSFDSGLSVFRGTRGAPEVHSEPQTRARVSQGVMQGLLIREVMPLYPPLARNLSIEGTVVLQASISKSGIIENLRVVSGPELLQMAAIDAVSQWRYRPYLLNGEPVDVETTVNVRFTLH